MNPNKHLEELVNRYPVLEVCKEQIQQAFELMRNTYEQGGKLLIAGNGGSCADAEHIVGELMKGFVKKRQLSPAKQAAIQAVDQEKGAQLAMKLQGSLPAIALSGHAALSTAFLNDVDADMIYAQQTYGYGRKGDLLLGISTSGNAKNIEFAAITAKALEMKVIGLAGRDGGALGKRADVCVIVPAQQTYQIQELHLPIYHTLCLMLEEYFFE